MINFQITPNVDETQEFIEIVNDFSNPLDGEGYTGTGGLSDFRHYTFL